MINLLNMNREQLHKFFLNIGECTYRADQVMQWIYHYYCDDFNYMTNINKNLRNKLNMLAKIRAPDIVKEYHSIDGTIKWIIKVDDQQIETVYIPEKKRSTLCISSQIGCAMQCTFCSTAQQGFNRNLQVSEIIGQIWRVAKIINASKKQYKPITNIVIMGMGEPLLNFNNIVSSIKIISENFGFGLSKKRITLSTSGVSPAIEKLGKVMNISLAISLHAPNDIIRNTIMPINKIYNIDSLLSAVRNYLNQHSTSHKIVTIEYVMLSHINDKVEHAHQLANILLKIPCKINLIPWNEIPNSEYSCSPSKQIDLFYKILRSYGFVTTIRKTRGNDISASCGQLTGTVFNYRFNKTHKNHYNNTIKFTRRL